MSRQPDIYEHLKELNITMHEQLDDFRYEIQRRNDKQDEAAENCERVLDTLSRRDDNLNERLSEMNERITQCEDANAEQDQKADEDGWKIQNSIEALEASLADHTVDCQEDLVTRADLEDLEWKLQTSMQALEDSIAETRDPQYEQVTHQDLSELRWSLSHRTDLLEHTVAGTEEFKVKHDFEVTVLKGIIKQLQESNRQLQENNMYLMQSDRQLRQRLGRLEERDLTQRNPLLQSVGTNVLRNSTAQDSSSAGFFG